MNDLTMCFVSVCVWRWRCLYHVTRALALGRGCAGVYRPADCIGAAPRRLPQHADAAHLGSILSSELNKARPAAHPDLREVRKQKIK